MAYPEAHSALRVVGLSEIFLLFPGRSGAECWRCLVVVALCCNPAKMGEVEYA